MSDMIIDYESKISIVIPYTSSTSDRIFNIFLFKYWKFSYLCYLKMQKFKTISSKRFEVSRKWKRLNECTEVVTYTGRYLLEEKVYL